MTQNGSLEDEDIDAPTYEELETLASLLREANQRKRLKGAIREALQELAEIEDQIKQRSSCPEERVRLSERLWSLNGQAHKNERGPLGRKKFILPRHRPRGAPSKTIDVDLDYQMIERAKELLPTKESLKPALRDAVKEALNEGRLPNIEIDSHIKRLERKIKKQGLI